MRARRRKSSTHSFVRRTASRVLTGSLRKNTAATTAVSHVSSDSGRNNNNGSKSSLMLRQSRTMESGGVRSANRRSTIRHDGESFNSRIERYLRPASKSHSVVSRGDSPGLSTSGTKRRTENSARSRHSSRAALDVAVSRLQRWGRIMIIRQLLRTPGALADRISVILKMEYRLWKLRVRMAKRVLREAFNSYAAAKREDPTLAPQRMREGAVTIINAFIRARRDDISTQRKRQVVFKSAVKVIERAWIKTPLYRYLKNLSLENRMQRLIIKQEDIERRDLIRQRWGFLVECHQRCYNDSVLLEAGIAVRNLEWWENAVMDADKEYMYKLRSSKEKSDKKEMIERPVQAESFLPRESRESIAAFVAQPSSSMSISCLDKQIVLTNDSSKRLMVSHTLDEEEALNDLSPPESAKDNRFYKRADASFVFGMLQEMGKLDFALSMGSRPIYLGVPLEFVDSLVCSTSLARLQETKNALKIIKSRFVYFGGAFLRENLQTLPLFKEISMQLHCRAMETWRARQQMCMTSEDADAVKDFFLQPSSRRKRRGKGMESPLNYSLSATIMGKEWVELYRSLIELLYPVGGKSNNTSLRIGCSTSSNSQNISYRRNVGQFHPRCGVRMTLQELTISGTKKNSAKEFKQSTSVTTRTSSGEDSMPPIKIFGSEYDSMYEIERLLIREYSHRLKLENQYDTEISALEWLFQREHTINIANSKKNNDKKDTSSEGPSIKASLSQTSSSYFEVLRNLLMA
ncbi:hypothetical protein LSM04_009058 [Trypanosoma melophagium]|uniref:uncharacterized protein n=1 Tax=Trypanosoma melophagium TaxID=715481 RepID=UPI003519EA6D|nr:hypothetical protein LSM04_009058 [Trypanosoma melophagium]